MALTPATAVKTRRGRRGERVPRRDADWCGDVALDQPDDSLHVVGVRLAAFDTGIDVSGLFDCRDFAGAFADSVLCALRSLPSQLDSFGMRGSGDDGDGQRSARRQCDRV